MGLETGEVRGSSSMVGTKEAKPIAAAAKQTTTVVQAITGVGLGIMQDLSMKCITHKMFMTAEEREVGPGRDNRGGRKVEVLPAE